MHRGGSRAKAEPQQPPQAVDSSAAAPQPAQLSLPVQPAHSSGAIKSGAPAHASAPAQPDLPGLPATTAETQPNAASAATEPADLTVSNAESMELTPQARRAIR